MNFSLPISLWHLYQSILDEHGRVNELPAGRWGDYWLTQSISHSDYANPYGPPIMQFGADGNNNAALPKVMVYDRPIDNSWAINSIPPPGTAVWQLKGKQLQIVRTSTIRSYMSGFVRALLDPAGPYPGIPIAGDSGSVCFVRQDGSWKVLGVCNLAGSCHLPFWTMDVRMPDASVVPARVTSLPSETVSESDFYFNEPTIIPFPMNLFLDKAPPNPWRVMSPYSANVDYGKDGVVLDVPCNFDPESVIIRGSGSDEWRFPDNYSHWHIRAWRLNESTLRLMFAKSGDCSRYSISLDGLAPIYAAPLSQSAPPVTTPPTDNTDIIEKPAENFEPLDIIFLQAEIVELRKMNRQLTEMNDSLREKVQWLDDHNTELKTALQNEQARVSGIQAKIDDFRAAINAIIK